MPTQNKTNFYIKLAAIVLIMIAAGAGILILKKPSEKLAPSKEPGKTELEGELVAGFPELPVYSGSALVNSYKKQEADMVGFEANWETDGTVSEIMSFYIETLPEEGWVIKEMPDTVNLYDQQLIAERDKTRFYLTVEEGEEKTEINVEIPLQ